MRGDPTRRAVAGLVGGMMTLAACADGDRSADAVTVFAAASLGDVFSDVAAAYEAETGDVVRVNVAGSSALRLQLDEGARADVFAPADLAQIELLDVPVDGEPVVVATTRVVSAHAAEGAPIGIDRFDEPGLLLGACAPQVPCGGYAIEAFALAGVEPALDTEEADVRALAAKVAEGELDAGIVYATDVVADERLAGVEPEAPVLVSYPVVRLAGSDDPDRAARFVDFLTGPIARTVFTEHGFEVP